MPNSKIDYLEHRLDGIYKMLMSAYEASHQMSSASKGREREIFVNAFLSNIFPPAFRFGNGEIIDSNGQKSGQLDIVIEYPFFPSIPTFSLPEPRLYLADGVAAVIEVKSDLTNQWQEVNATATKLKEIKRSQKLTIFGNSITSEKPIPSLAYRNIPFFAVGYNGWKQKETLKNKLKNSSVDGILVLESGLFIANSDFRETSGKGSACLWALVTCLYLATTSAIISTADPMNYFKNLFIRPKNNQESSI